ncbi:MAG TPA: hypothetical protein VI942_04165 [Thermoanaerobaculia bacterium]|nr:hypothetical protein [Thermoanaerobaculia bacterium]
MRRLAFRRFGLGLAVGAGLALAAPAAAAGPQFGLRASAYLEDSDPALGLEVLFPLSAPEWAVVPNAEVVFDDERDRWVVNVDVQRAVHTKPEYAIWVGGGAAWIHFDEGDRADSEDDLGLNLLAGIGWRLEGMTPYAQLKVVAADDAELVASIGLRF